MLVICAVLVAAVMWIDGELARRRHLRAVIEDYKRSGGRWP